MCRTPRLRVPCPQALVLNANGLPQPKKLLLVTVVLILNSPELIIHEKGIELVIFDDVSTYLASPFRLNIHVIVFIPVGAGGDVVRMFHTISPTTRRDRIRRFGYVMMRHGHETVPTIHSVLVSAVVGPTSLRTSNPHGRLGIVAEAATILAGIHRVVRYVTAGILTHPNGLKGLMASGPDARSERRSDVRKRHAGNKVMRVTSGSPHRLSPLGMSSNAAIEFRRY